MRSHTKSAGVLKGPVVHRCNVHTMYMHCALSLCKSNNVGRKYMYPGKQNIPLTAVGSDSVLGYSCKKGVGSR